MPKNYAYLVQVNAINNNNKFYEIIENDDDTVSVKYGRVGGTVMTKDYSHTKNFWMLKSEKEAKGYEDRTALHSNIDRSQTVSKELSFKPVENKDVQELLDLLITSSREFMQKNYKVSSEEITQKMIDEAQRDIDSLSRIEPGTLNSLYYFNSKLEELFTDIPRKMGRVADYLAHTEADFSRILQREQDMLDNVKGLLVQTQLKDNEQKQERTVLEAYGLDIRPVTFKEEDEITTHLGRDYNGLLVEDRFVRGFVVENHKTRNAYEQYKRENKVSSKDVRLFYHGSKVENWYSIAKAGLSLNPNARTTGKMFGQGLYFAPESRKALNYMDVKGSHWNDGTRETGYCAVYAVALGKCYEPNYVLGSSFKEKDLPKGYNSVFASKNNQALGLKNDEYIVYSEKACTIKYLLEMSQSNVIHKEYKLNREVLRNALHKGFLSLEKTKTGAKAELLFDKLSSSVASEIRRKITADCKQDRLFVHFDRVFGTILFETVSADGTSHPVLPDITKHDYVFVSRELKRAFAESELEWKVLAKSFDNYEVGETIVRKDTLPHSKAKNEKVGKEIE